MVIRGRTRGNGRQLAKYLLAQGENEHIQILDVNARANPQDQHLHDALLSMSLTSELTKSDKGLYHSQINPAYGEDKAMTPQRWLQAADMLGKELGLDDQRRIIVLHTKKGRTHAHVVWERYDLQKGIMISDSFSRLAQDRARQAMEKVFEQQKTPHRNVKRPEMKDVLSTLWQLTKTGAEFIKEAHNAGYIIAKGIQRRPFMVVDETGRSFDLVRQLDGTKTKEVRERLEKEKLPLEKAAMTLSKSQKTEKKNDNTQEKWLDIIEVKKEQPKIKQEEKRLVQVKEFAATKKNIFAFTASVKNAKTLQSETPTPKITEADKSKDTPPKKMLAIEVSPEQHIAKQDEKKLALVQEFASAKKDIAIPETTTEKERIKQERKHAFLNAWDDIEKSKEQEVTRENNLYKAKEFTTNRPDILKSDKQPSQEDINQAKAMSFAENKPDITPALTEKELRKQKFLQAYNEMEKLNAYNKERGIERD